VKKKQILALVFAGVMALSVLTGCGGDNDNQATPQPPATEGNTTQVPGEPVDVVDPDAPVEYEEKTVRWFFRNGPTAIVPKDADICKIIYDDIKIIYEHVPTGDNSNETLNMLLAAGDIPDVITSYQELTTQLIDSGHIVPVEQYLNEETIPNVIRIANNWEEAVAILTRADGHTWAFPHPNGVSLGPTPFIRYDWLEALDLEVPTTLDELKDVLIAFTHNDPDGNDRNDTFGTAFANDGWNATYFNEPFAIGEWHMEEDGLVNAGGYTERNRERLKYLNELMNEGVLPADTFSYNDDTLLTMKRQSRIGYTFDYNNYTNINDDLQAVVPTADFAIMEPVKGPYYDKGYLGATSVLREQHTLTRVADPEAVFRLWDYMSVDTTTDVANPTFEGSYWTSRYGTRGKYWDVTPEGLFDTGQFDTPESQQIKANLELEPYMNNGGCHRIRNKFDMASLMATQGKNLDMNVLHMAMPTMNQLNTDGLATNLIPLRTEGVVFDVLVTEFNANMDFIGQQLLAECLKAGADVDKLFDDYLAEAERNGYQAVREAATQGFRDAGRIQ